MQFSLNPVSTDFPVWVASQVGDLEAFGHFVQGGHARQVGLQFFHYRPGYEVAPADFRSLREGLMLHALVALDYAARRIAAGVGRIPYAWLNPDLAVRDWDKLRRLAGIRGYEIPVSKVWK